MIIFLFGDQGEIIPNRPQGFISGEKLGISGDVFYLYGDGLGILFSPRFFLIKHILIYYIYSIGDDL